MRIHPGSPGISGSCMDFWSGFYINVHTIRYIFPWTFSPIPAGLFSKIQNLVQTPSSLANASPFFRPQLCPFPACVYVSSMVSAYLPSLAIIIIMAIIFLALRWACPVPPQFSLHNEQWAPSPIFVLIPFLTSIFKDFEPSKVRYQPELFVYTFWICNFIPLILI